jgi:hypothetical protein
VYRGAAMNRRRVGVVLVGVAAAAAVAVVLGVGGLWAHPSSRKAVNAYIKQVDAVQQQMRLPLTRLLTVYRNFSTRGVSPRVQAQLAGAERTLRTLQLRISAIQAPPDAMKLRRLVLRLVVVERAVASEIDAIGRFAPRFHATLVGATAANVHLARALAAVHQPKSHLVRGSPKKIARARASYAAAAAKAAGEQADAVDAYDRALALVVARLRTLRPPAVMAPAYRAQVRSLEATIVAGTALAQELRKKNHSRVPLLGREFTEAARQARTVAAQRSEIAAIKGYNARVQAVGALQGEIQAELTHLSGSLG